MSGQVGKYEFRASSRTDHPDRPDLPAAVAVFAGKPGETKQLAGTVRLTGAELVEFKQRLENPVVSDIPGALMGDLSPIHWAQYDGLSVAITRSEHDGKLIVVLESLTEEPLDVRISRDGDDRFIWEGTVGE